MVFHCAFIFDSKIKCVCFCAVHCHVSQIEFEFGFLLISLAISPIRFAYSITDNTPPCLMLSLILICLVFPYLVRIVFVYIVYDI